MELGVWTNRRAHCSFTRLELPPVLNY